MIWTCFGQFAVNYELLCTPESSRDKCEAICPTAEAWLKLNYDALLYFDCYVEWFIEHSVFESLFLVFVISDVTIFCNTFFFLKYNA